MESIHLSGSDDVLRAAHMMRSAADDMRSAASSISSSYEQHQRLMSDVTLDFRNIMEGHQTFLTGWLQDFEKILSEYRP